MEVLGCDGIEWGRRRLQPATTGSLCHVLKCTTTSSHADRGRAGTFLRRPGRPATCPRVEVEIGDDSVDHYIATTGRHVGFDRSNLDGGAPPPCAVHAHLILHTRTNIDIRPGGEADLRGSHRERADQVPGSPLEANALLRICHFACVEIRWEGVLRAENVAVSNR